ncbi:MAG: MBL fold metallo-hydrolase RNA specificity domain-containing protein [Candidatus Binataceae bacterium]
MSSAGAPSLRFLGAAATVTGSRFLLRTSHAQILVECGLFQGLKELRLRNWATFPVAPQSLDAIALTHAHLDHSGYLPALCRDGFRGPIFASAGTRDLCRILLPDSGRLQEEEAAYANRKGYSKHHPALPLYTEDDALKSLEHFQAVEFGAPVAVARGIRARFQRAGHILGSSTIAIELEECGGRTVLFSGDLGRPNHPLLKPPAPPAGADVIVVEATYGDQRHDDSQSLARFEQVLRDTIKRGGVVLIPSFAVDRTEVVLFHLRRLVRAGRIPPVPVYVDSPMALAALRIYKSAIAGESAEMRSDRNQDEVFDPENLFEVRTVAESKALNQQSGPMIIVSASGMATGGRVLHHLSQRLPDPRNSVLLVGFQAEGTRGRTLRDGAPSVKMLGHHVPVRAEIADVPGFSVHADQEELLAWLGTAQRAPELVCVVHGNPPACNALCDAIKSRLGWKATVAANMEELSLG